MLAVTQIMAKGTFSAEELRGQLAERLPQAVGALAKALGVSTEELNKLMEGSKRITSDALIPMSRELVKMAGGAEGVAKASESATAELKRLGNVTTELNNIMGQAGLLAAGVVRRKGAHRAAHGGRHGSGAGLCGHAARRGAAYYQLE